MAKNYKRKWQKMLEEMPFGVLQKEAMMEASRNMTEAEAKEACKEFEKLNKEAVAINASIGKYLKSLNKRKRGK